MSALLIQGVPIACINRAAITYVVPAQVIMAVLLTEGGHLGQASPNKNGSVDLGPLQINSSWLPTLAHYGYSRYQIQYDGCSNVMVGAWILSGKIAAIATTPNDYWRGVASYHSVTPAFNNPYQQQVYQHYQALAQLLS